MSVVGYLRVSSDQQCVDSQKLGITNFCEKEKLVVERWVSETVSGVKDIKSRRLGGLLPNLQAGDILIVSELSRLGRSTSMVVQTIEKLVKRKIDVVCVKQNLRLSDSNDTQNMMGKMFVCVAALFAEMERDLLIARVREGIQRCIANGHDWGAHVRGKKFNTYAAQKHDEIIQLYLAGKTGIYIARKLRLSVGTVYNHLKAAGVARRATCVTIN